MWCGGACVFVWAGTPAAPSGKSAPAARGKAFVRPLRVCTLRGNLIILKFVRDHFDIRLPVCEGHARQRGCCRAQGGGSGRLVLENMIDPWASSTLKAAASSNACVAGTINFGKKPHLLEGCYFFSIL
jgi:hypothetical protein